MMVTLQSNQTLTNKVHIQHGRGCLEVVGGNGKSVAKLQEYQSCWEGQGEGHEFESEQ